MLAMRATSEIILTSLFMVHYLDNLVLGLGELGLLYDTVFNGKVCNSLVEYSLSSKVQCASVCATNSDCKSLFYTETNWGCTLCSEVFIDLNDTGLLFRTGSKYYSPSVSYQDILSDGSYGTPCVGTWACIEPYTVCYPVINICVCHPNYVYNPATGACTQSCIVFGSTYQKYPQSVLLQSNIYIDQGMDDVNVCLQTCTSLTGPTVCYGVDYHRVDKACHYNSKQVGSAPQKWRSDSYEFDSYSRNCA